MKNSNKTLDLLEQSALEGRATAVDLFVTTLNPKNRTKRFKWSSLPGKAAGQAIVNARNLMPTGVLPWWEKAILNTAADEAHAQMDEMIETSQVDKWCRKKS